MIAFVPHANVYIYKSIYEVCTLHRLILTSDSSKSTLRSSGLLLLCSFVYEIYENDIRDAAVLQIDFLIL